MGIVSIVSGLFCHAEEISKDVADQLGYEYVTEEAIINEAAKLGSSTVEKVKRAMYGTPTFLNNITHEKELNTAFLKAAVAIFINKDNIVLNGFAGLLIPKKISHVLKVYINSNREYRFDNAINSGISEKEANKIIRKNDNDSVRWSHYLYQKAPWDESLFDILLPMHSSGKQEAVKEITESIRKPTLITTVESKNSVADYILSTRINVALVNKGHNVEVNCMDGDISVLLNKYVIRLEHYKNELMEIINEFSGVRNVEIKFGTNVQIPTSQRRLEFELPSKILLVDDEIEFVHTLSERLKTRSIDTSVVYDGEEALSVVGEEEPEVMILDLKMPGIDGIEVLRKVKATSKTVEVIILTGHGSVKEKELAESLGAFAYLEKPVNIEDLTKVMQKAYSKVNQAKSAENDR
jgi:CheY-like chemotaxis protein